MVLPYTAPMEPTKNPAPVDQALRRRLWDHPFEHPGRAQDILRRLCIEQAWNIEEARAAIEEYRRFCYLACVAWHPVTPSDRVDMVWHTHLVHTHDYWGPFCNDVLRRPFHHGPTQGGAQEEARYYDQYAQTLASYAQHFGPPPEHWWPAARTRFEPMRHWRWIYLPDHWVIPNPLRKIKQMLRSLLSRFQARSIA